MFGKFFLSQSRSSYDGLTKEELDVFLQKKQYGDFELTDAVRPSYDLRIVPTEGYRYDVWKNEEAEKRVPVIMAAATRRKLMPLFMAMVNILGDEVDVVLETSHRTQGILHVDHRREGIDLPVLKSILQDYEDILLDDGCSGIAVIDSCTKREVQFDEHKQMYIYGKELSDAANILHDHRIQFNQAMQFLTEAEHVHRSDSEYAERYQELCRKLGIGGYENEQELSLV